MEENKHSLDVAKEISSSYRYLQAELSKRVIGQKSIIEHLVIVILAKGHGLIIGAPGLAKTLLVSTLAEVLELKFSRIQFTPDLMPSDITGTEILEEDSNTRTRSFKFVKGPIFSSVILADEINRTPPKTQAALLESMQEGKVTSGGIRYDLPVPFLVLATQNPVEQEGTYPLPEAQLDRFMFSLNIGYPTEDEEIEVVRMKTSSKEDSIKKIWDKAKILEYQALVRQVPVSDHLVSSAVSLVRATRPETSKSKLVKSYVSWGAGPRASQYLVLASKARAILHGKNTPDMEDLQEVSYPVLQHRIITSFAAEAEGITQRHIIDEVRNAVFK